ncbi:hypothetical protein ACNKHS_13615 [Shigella flexneri]
MNDENGEIALCTLSAFNLGAVRAWTNWKSWPCWRCRCAGCPARLRITQSRPLNADGGMGRRTLGIGVIDFAYWLAKNGKRYSDGSADETTHQP